MRILVFAAQESAAKKQHKCRKLIQVKFDGFKAGTMPPNIWLHHGNNTSKNFAII